MKRSDLERVIVEMSEEREELKSWFDTQTVVYDSSNHSWMVVFKMKTYNTPSRVSLKELT